SGAFLLLMVGVAAGVHHALDQAVAEPLWQDVPCWGRTVSERIDTLFAAELSVLYALGMGLVCLRARRPFAAGWILFLLLAGIGVEIIFKYYFTHPSPSTFLNTLGR